MKFSKILILACSAIAAMPVHAERLVILHTNDTHSQIDPASDGLGGIRRRKALIDSVRSTNSNVLLIDAGDAVQGTLYFKIGGGRVEQQLMNALGYDLRILGNHEFDNGVDSLATILSEAKSQFLATNYDLDKSPLKNRFDKYAIKEYDGRRIGFIAINLAPKGMIAEGNYDGVEYLDAVKAANATAWWLKHIEKCDLVVAITHIGYNPVTGMGDVKLASESEDIDIIIGGHSHDLIKPGDARMQYLIPNRNGREVLVTQEGKAGKNVGQITIDLDNLSSSYSVIPVDSRWDSRTDQSLDQIIAPYTAGIDSLMTRTPVARTRREFSNSSAELLNWTTDVVLELGRGLASGVDFAILNKGGLRRNMPKGTVHEGQILDMIPFNNRVQVLDIKGSDLLEAFRVMAIADGNGVSKGVEIVYTPGTEANRKQDASLVSATLNGKPIDADRTYRIATIDYLAGGGDYMTSLRNHTLVASSDRMLYDDVLRYLRSGKGLKTINPDSTVRMHTR